MTISITPNSDNTSAVVQVSGVDRLILNSDSTLTTGASPTVADIGSRKVTTMEQFAVLKSGSGWKKEPNGIITQWGNIDATAASSGTASFPIVFPNATLVVLLSNPVASVASAGGYGPRITGTATTATFPWDRGTNFGSCSLPFLTIGH